MKKCVVKVIKEISKKGNEYCKILIFNEDGQRLIYENFIPRKEYEYYRELIHTM